MTIIFLIIVGLLLSAWALLTAGAWMLVWISENTTWFDNISSEEFDDD